MDAGREEEIEKEVKQRERENRRRRGWQTFVVSLPPSLPPEAVRSDPFSGLAWPQPPPTPNLEWRERRLQRAENRPGCRLQGWSSWTGPGATRRRGGPSKRSSTWVQPGTLGRSPNTEEEEEVTTFVVLSLLLLLSR